MIRDRMPLLKDTESEQLRQLVKACLLEISKLKFELKKCQNESSKSIDKESIQNKNIKDLNNESAGKNGELLKLKQIINEKDEEIAELLIIKTYFEAMISRPRKDLTSFQSQLYALLPDDCDTLENLYAHITTIGFTELTIENFSHALRNLERKGYFKVFDEDGTTFWQKING